MQQPEALPGPSLDQWHRSAGEEEDGPGTALPRGQDVKGPLPVVRPSPPCLLPFKS